MERKDRVMSDVSPVAVITLYKGCAIYKDLQKKKKNPHLSVQKSNPTYPTRSNICSNNQTKLLSPLKHRGRTIHQPITSKPPAPSAIPTKQWHTRIETHDERHLRTCI
jgi:hypothetical protein